MVYGGVTQLTAGFTGDAKDLFRRMRPDSGHEGKDYLSSKVILMTASQTQTMWNQKPQAQNGIPLVIFEGRWALLWLFGTNVMMWNDAQVAKMWE